MAKVDPIVAEFDAELTSDERELIGRAQQFAVEVIAPQSAVWERTAQYPIVETRAACEIGLAAIEVPKELGGLGMSFAAKLRVCEELAAVDFGFAFSLVNHHNATLRVAEHGSKRSAELLPFMLDGELLGGTALTEPGHGSDLANLTTSAERTSGGWVLDGTKAWTTNGAVGKVFITLAQTDRDAGARGLATFLVEARPVGFRRGPAYNLLGALAIGVGEFRLAQYWTPDESLMSAPGEAFSSSLASINAARCYVAAMCAGMLEASIRRALERTKSRVAFGQPVIEFQGLRWSLVDAQTDLAALRLLTYRAARLIARGEPAEQAAAQAKKFAGDRTLLHIAACLQAMGAEGLHSRHPLARHMAAAKIACFTDGSTEMMNERLGKGLVK